MGKIKEKEEKAEGATATIPLEWYFMDGLATPFATNMVVQTLEDVFKVSFFEVKPPLKFDDSEPQPSKVRADCVASVFITPGRLPKFIEVLQSQYEKYMATEHTKEL